MSQLEQDFMEQYLRGADHYDRSQKIWTEEERDSFINGSEFATCIRKQRYKIEGAEQDGPENWGYARRGTHIEKYVLACLRAANVPLLFTGEDQIWLRNHDDKVACTPDGLAEVEVDGETHFVALEIKSFDPRKREENILMHEHQEQLRLAMEMWEQKRERIPELGSTPISGGWLIYINCSDYNDYRIYPVPLDPSVYGRAKARAKLLFSKKKTDTLPREGAARDQKKECQQRCNFCNVCGVRDAVTDGQASRANRGTEFAAAVAEHAAADLLEKAAKDRKAAVREAIEKGMMERKKDVLPVGDYIVHYKKQAGRTSTDLKAMEADGIDVPKYQTRGKPSMRLEVKAAPKK